MPRGRAPGYELQRETIVAEAAALFARQGYTATSMNEVAEACGVSKPALYHYVRDKHCLLVEITEGHIARLLAIVETVSGEKQAPEPHLRSLIAAFLAVYADSQNEHRVLTEDVKFLQADERRRVLGGQRRVVAAFADAVTAARPELRGAGLDKPLAMLLFGMMNWMFTWLQPGGELTYADMAPVVADLFFAGLAGVRAPASKRSRSSLPHHDNGDDPCPSATRKAPSPEPSPPSPPSVSPRRPRPSTSRTPTSTSA